MTSPSNQVRLLGGSFAPWATSFVALLALGCAAGAVVAVVWAARTLVPMLRDGRAAGELQILWQLEAEWASDNMTEVRARAAAALLEERRDPGLDEVLRFLDQVGYIVRKHGIDHELVWYRFYWPALCYWKASNSVRQQSLKAALDRYDRLGWLVTVLMSVEQRRGGKGQVTGPTPDQVRDFLLAEARGGSCRGDEEESTEEPTQMTPL